jgi:hypothetical protein
MSKIQLVTSLDSGDFPSAKLFDYQQIGAGCGTRTHDLGIMRPSLYL